MTFYNQSPKGQLKMDDSYLSKAEKDIIESMADKSTRDRDLNMAESFSDEGCCINSYLIFQSLHFLK